MEIIARTQVNKYLSLSSPVNVRKVEEKKTISICEIRVKIPNKESKKCLDSV